MKKRILSLLLAAVMAASLLVGCGNKSDEQKDPASDGGQQSSASQTGNETPKGDPVVINLALSQGEHTDDLVNFLPKFEEENNVKVNVDIITESGYIQKVMLGLSAEKQEYDVFMASNGMWGQLLDSGWAHPLEEFIADDSLTSQEWRDGFADSMLDVVTRDGHRYAVVYQMGTNILYYNKAIFAANGLDPDSPPKTLAEVLEVAEKLNHPEDGQYGIVFRASREQTINTFFWLMLWFSQGGNWYDVPGCPDIAVLDQPAAIQATQYYADFHKYAPQGIANYGFEDAMLAMQQGKAAMWIDTSILAGNLLNPENSLISEDVGFSAFEEGRAIGAPWTFMMAKNTEHPEESWKLMEYLTGFEVTWEQTKSGKQTSPVRTDVLEHPEIDQYMNAELGAALAKSLETACPLYWPVISQTAEIRNIMSVNISDAAAGKKTAEEAMLETNAETIKILQRDGLM
jgi:multiple sugar transport system substrate-binding protein